MLRWTIVFFIFSLIAGFFGFVDLALTTSNIARILFFVFIIMFVLSLFTGLFKGKTKGVINLIFVLMTFATTLTVKAEETIGEKTHVAVNAVARGIKKGANRVEESLCAKGDLKCAGTKVKNRAVEAKDSAIDAIQETKNKLD
jgi:uncharacterized membrane protein YtjA (UPF0391 family)